MIPEECRLVGGAITISEDRPTLRFDVLSTGDRLTQIGSHLRFVEVNSTLSFDRRIVCGSCLDIPAGTVIRLEPGDSRPVHLVTLTETRRVFGLAGETDDPAEG